VFVAPLAAENSVLVAALTPPGARAEAFGWLLTAVTAGGAAGNAFGGWCTVRTGPQAALVLAGAVLALAGVTTVVHPGLRRAGGSR
jgi:MFS family permease